MSLKNIPKDYNYYSTQLMNLADTYNGEWTAGGQGAENLLPWKRIIKCFNNYYFYDINDLHKFLFSLQNTDIKIEYFTNTLCLKKKLNKYFLVKFIISFIIFL